VVAIEAVSLLRDLVVALVVVFLPFFFVVFLLAGIGSLETPKIDLAHLQHGF